MHLSRDVVKLVKIFLTFFKAKAELVASGAACPTCSAKGTKASTKATSSDVQPPQPSKKSTDQHEPHPSTSSILRLEPLFPGLDDSEEDEGPEVNQEDMDTISNSQ